MFGGFAEMFERFEQLSLSLPPCLQISALH